MSETISILMGVYNCEGTLSEAIESIRNQTYTNWELIMCDDGSQDGTFDLAKRYAERDNRIILLKNDKNEGLNRTLNHCLAYATGKFIARMDGDDKSLSERFEKQVAFLKTHADYQIVSTPMLLFDENGVWGRTSSIESPTAEDIIAGSPICHAPVMMWKKCMDQVGGYTEDKRMIRVEDVNLWIKLYQAGYRCYNLPEPLYSMRNDQNALNRRKYKYRVNSTYVRLKGCIDLHLGLKSCINACKPMIIGLAPAKVRKMIRRKQMKHAEN